MRKMILTFIAAVILLSSCSLSPSVEIEPKLYMVAMGIGYDKTESILPLDCTKGDMNAITEQIRLMVGGMMDYEIVTYSDEEDGFTLRVSSSQDPQEKVIPVLRDPVDEILKSFSDEADENDLVIFYYAGHGEDVTGDLVYHYRYGTNDYESLSVRDLNDDILSKIKGRKLLILDSCYSGNFIEEGDLEPTHSYDGKGNLESFDLFSSIRLSFEALNSDAPAKPESYVLSAASDVQSSYENKTLGHGYFTYALLSYLGYDTESETATYDARFTNDVITVQGLYEGIVENFPFKEEYKNSTPSITPSRYDMVLFDFR